MKTIKFTPELAELVLAGKKNSTWRLFDDKDLLEGDEISLVNQKTLDEFATGIITEMYEKKLADIDESDYDSHAHYDSQEQLLASMRKYYGEKVTLDDEVKVIKFVLFL